MSVGGRAVRIIQLLLYLLFTLALSIFCLLFRLEPPYIPALFMLVLGAVTKLGFVAVKSYTHKVE